MRSAKELEAILREVQEVINSKNLNASEALTVFSALGAAAIDIGTKVMTTSSPTEIANALSAHSLVIYKTDLVSSTITEKD